MSTIEFVPALALAALVIKIIDFFKYLSNRDLNGAGTQLVVWAAGVGAVFLYAQTAWADTIDFGGSLSTLNGWSLLAVGLSVGSGASVVKDGFHALDNSLTTKQQHLLK